MKNTQAMAQLHPIVKPSNPSIHTVASTGALITLHSAISHLAHFCAVISNTNHTDNQPLYNIDPPVFAEGWHSFGGLSQSLLFAGSFGGLSQGLLFAGPFGSSVTLPRKLFLPERQFTVDRIYTTMSCAHRHSAFKLLYSMRIFYRLRVY